MVEHQHDTLANADLDGPASRLSKERNEGDIPSLRTSDSNTSSSPSVPPGRRNSVEMLTLTPVGGGRPDVVRAREAIESVNYRSKGKK